MRGIEAETCRLLIAWADKNLLSLSRNGLNITLYDESDNRDTVEGLETNEYTQKNINRSSINIDLFIYVPSKCAFVILCFFVHNNDVF